MFLRLRFTKHAALFHSVKQLRIVGCDENPDFPCRIITVKVSNSSETKT